jgi:fatty acid synthase, animal type
MNGLEVPINNLYPRIEFPVSRGTPMISPMIGWDHSEDWFVTKFESQRAKKSGERKVDITLGEQDFEYIGGHIIDGN